MRFARIVTPGTSWKWNSRSGVTPSCAASVVPAASATGAGRKRRNRSPSGDAIATMPAVAVTESWKPIDHTSQGSRTRSTRTAAARTEPVARGLPISTPTSAIVAITPARITDGSAPVITTKKTTVPTARPNLGHRVSRSIDANPTIGASTIATFSPETTSRCPRPLAWKSRIMPGSSREASPNASPSSNPASFAGKSRAIDRPTNARNTCAARTNGLGDGPMRSTSLAFSSTTIPLCSSASRNPGSSGRRITPPAVTTSPRTHGGGSSSALSHSDARSDAAAPGHSTRVTSSVACHPNAPASGSVCSVPTTVTRCGARRASNESSSHEACTPDQPAPSRTRPIIASAIAVSGEPPTPDGVLTASRATCPGSASPVVTSGSSPDAVRGAASHAPTSPARPTAIPIHGRTHDGRTSHASSPVQNAAAAAGSAHAFIPWRTGGSVRASTGRCRSRRSGHRWWRTVRSVCGNR